MNANAVGTDVRKRQDEGLNPKSESRKPKEIRSPKSEIRKQPEAPSLPPGTFAEKNLFPRRRSRCFGLRISDFGFPSAFGFRISDFRPRPSWLLCAFLLSAAAAVSAAPLEVTNLPPVAPNLPDVTLSLLRIFGALLLVLSLFLGGAWLLRNWQRVAGQRGRPAKLQVLEMRSLGNRHAVFVVGYEQQRLLVASSPAGITLLDHLPAASATETEAAAVPPSFAEALRKLLPAR